MLQRGGAELGVDTASFAWGVYGVLGSAGSG